MVWLCSKIRVFGVVWSFAVRVGGDTDFNSAICHCFYIFSCGRNLVFIAHTTTIRIVYPSPSLDRPQPFAAQATGLRLVHLRIREFIYPIRHILRAWDWMEVPFTSRLWSAGLERAKSLSSACRRQRAWRYCTCDFSASRVNHFILWPDLVPWLQLLTTLRHGSGDPPKISFSWAVSNFGFNSLLGLSLLD